MCLEEIKHKQKKCKIKVKKSNKSERKVVLVSYRLSNNRYPGCTTRTSVPQQPTALQKTVLQKQPSYKSNRPTKYKIKKIRKKIKQILKQKKNIQKNRLSEVPFRSSYKKQNRSTKSNRPTESNRPTKYQTKVSKKSSKN